MDQKNEMSRRIRGVDVKFDSSGNPIYRDASQGQAPGTGRPVYEDPNKRGRFQFYPEPIEKTIDPVGTMVRKVTPPPPGVPQVESISQSTRLDIILETVDQLLESRRKTEKKLARLLAGRRTPTKRISADDRRARNDSLQARETIPSDARGSLEAIAYLQGLHSQKDTRGIKKFVNQNIPTGMGGTKVAGVPVEPVAAAAAHLAGGYKTLSSRPTDVPHYHGSGETPSPRVKRAKEKAERTGKLRK